MMEVRGTERNRAMKKQTYAKRVQELEAAVAELTVIAAQQHGIIECQQAHSATLLAQNEALLRLVGEQNITLGQLVYDDPQFDGAVDVLAEIQRTVQTAKANMRQEREEAHVGGKGQAFDYGWAIEPS